MQIDYILINIKIYNMEIGKDTEYDAFAYLRNNRNFLDPTNRK